MYFFLRSFVPILPVGPRSLSLRPASARRHLLLLQGSGKQISVNGIPSKFQFEGFIKTCQTGQISLRANNERSGFRRSSHPLV